MSARRFENRIWSSSAIQHGGWIAGLLLGGTLVYQWFPASGNDDSYITYWSAYALSEFGRLTNYNGAAIEQSSSLLLVAMLAAIRELSGIDPHHAGPVLSALSAAMTLVAVAWLSRLARLRYWFGPPLILSVLLPFAYWSTSGMEAT